MNSKTRKRHFILEKIYATFATWKLLVNRPRLGKSLVYRAVAKRFCQAGAAGVSGGLAAGPGRAAPPQERGNRVPERPLLPRTGVTTGDADVFLPEGIFQNPSPRLPSPSFLSSGRFLVAARDNRPPHPARLPAPRLSLPAKPSLNDRAPLPCPHTVSRARQARDRALAPDHRGQRSGIARRPGPGGAVAPAPLPGPASAPPGCSRPPAARKGGSPQCQACVFVV